MVHPQAGIVLALTTLTAPTPDDDAVAHRGDLRDRLLAVVLRDLGVDVGERADVAHLCRTCGSTDHGQPRVQEALAAGVHVSVAHTGSRVVVAASAEGPVGVDVEEVAAVGAHPVADVLLSLAEVSAGHPGDAEALAVTWARKEALLKATGHGLAVPPPAVTLSLPGDGEPRLLGWEGPGAAPRVLEWFEPGTDDGERVVAVVLGG